MILMLSNSDYNFFCKYADAPFSGFDVLRADKLIKLSYKHDNARSAWRPFERAYDDAYLEHAPGPDYEPDSIGLRLERISDNLVYQSHHQ